MGITTLLTAIAISIVSSLLVSVFLNKPLHHMLRDLCGTEQRASFWHHYTALMLMILPLLAVMLFFPIEGAFDGQFLQRTLICVMTGQGLALATIGFTLARFIRQAE